MTIWAGGTRKFVTLNLSFRILAASLLPLGKDTLVYGSNDGGKNIRATNSEMNMKVEMVARMLNLRNVIFFSC